ncbi:alkaline phosphatase [Parafrankia colletiae]|uniref:Alkaline phosphatase n=1 Tax=Parafrankia colletiae TaxID=573497 RepID=A0A1S1QDY2_9ACTN|nr:alkaline phosphatase D family protein [Parafrankia colletiae]MCK9902140.1 alkaline phosphatase D family protein [Frankia sp. Cpl3]OHV31681.1 alkaline phosphatase [Parafrankia colletiae]
MTISSEHSAELRAAARGLERRRFLTLSGAAATLAFTVGLPGTASASAPALAPGKVTSDPFTLGVASGDPQPNSALLWTRLAPQPLVADGGLPPARIPVAWEIASDERFRRIVRRGDDWAHPEFGHSLHVDVPGLAPDREYYYRFRVGSWVSPAGRTRTAPAPGAPVRSMTFATVSCQRYDQGYYTAYRHLAQENVDAVFHTGDYLYEYAVNSAGGTRAYTDRVLPDAVNRETATLEDYRVRYGLYKSDPDLIAAHAAHPFVVTWDDHEVENNYAGGIPENSVPPEEFLLRRAAAYRAYWENMPLRRPQFPQGPDMSLYRRFGWGRLAQFDVLDTRQYRTNQANGDGWKPPSAESEAESMTLPGLDQERWLIDGWARSNAQWNIASQQVVFSRRASADGSANLSMDSWDGYPASRRRVLDGWKRGLPRQGRSGKELMVLTGDVHVAYGFDIHDDPADPASEILGTEVVATSITSGGNGSAQPSNWAGYHARNPHLKFYNGLRGYVLVNLGATAAEIDWKTVSHVSTPGGTLVTAGSFVTQAGSPGLVAR